MTRRKILVALAGLALAGCGPSLKTPEDAASFYMKKDMERAPIMVEREIAIMEWALECAEKEMEWWADRGAWQNDIDQIRAALEYRKDNLGKIQDDMTIDPVDIQKGRGDRGKTVVMSVWRYSPAEVAPGSRMYYLRYVGGKQPMELVEVDGKWKRRNKD
jgi:hypothetical protein